MYLLILFKSAFRSLGVNKLRTFLASLGVVIGISSVIIVYASGEGIKSLVSAQFQVFGSDTIETETKIPTNKKDMASQSTDMAQAMAAGAQVTTLKIEDMEAVKKIDNIVDGYAVTYAQDIVSYENESHKTFIWGASASYIDIDKGQITKGRFYTDSEDRSLSSVVVLGSKINQDLFGQSDSVGKYVKIRNAKYQVIGVMAERGKYMGVIDFDNMMYIPVRTTIKKILGVEHILWMFHKMKNVSLAYETSEEIKSLIRARHNITDPIRDDFRVVSMVEAMDILNTIMGALKLLLLAIVAISLVVGGVGIMNIMYATVTERQFEIGLRKSLGATSKDIVNQFIVEAVLKTSIGGFFGIILGMMLSYVIAIVAQSKGLAWEFNIPYQAYIVSLSFSVFFGILFGVMPAKKAAKLDPVEALRAEQ
ncbi:MAG: ABC transporter permease [Candidatus Falkowbacteria bacterium]|nr:ABC transporter permease [Candidatus Falkowbacteria bacterium]